VFGPAPIEISEAAPAGFGCVLLAGFVRWIFCMSMPGAVAFSMRVGFFRFEIFFPATICRKVHPEWNELPIWFAQWEIQNELIMQGAEKFGIERTY